MNRTITDIHMHCVWGYDDGSSDINMTRKLLTLSCEQGVNRIVCTSHGDVFIQSQKDYDAQFKKLEKLCSDSFPKLRVCVGTEIRVYPGVEKTVLRMLSDGKLHFLGNSDKAMIELTVSNSLGSNLAIIETLMAEGLKVVVAHAERYNNFAESIGDIERLVKRGCEIQINAYSLAREHNPLIRSKAQELVRRRLVHYIGSDAHRTDHRPPLLSDGVDWIYENVPKDYADQIVYKNAEAFFL